MFHSGAAGLVSTAADVARFGRMPLDGGDGGLGTSWRSDPTEDLTGVLLTQAAWTSPVPPAVCRDFWTCVYAALDD